MTGQVTTLIIITVVAVQVWWIVKAHTLTISTCTSVLQIIVMCLLTLNKVSRKNWNVAVWIE